MISVDLKNQKTMKEVNQIQQDFEVLSFDEIVQIEGGSFWGDTAYVVGATLACIWEFSRSAAEYQQSLPPNLKK